MPGLIRMNAMFQTDPLRYGRLTCAKTEIPAISSNVAIEPTAIRLVFIVCSFPYKIGELQQQGTGFLPFEAFENQNHVGRKPKYLVVACAIYGKCARVSIS